MTSPASPYVTAVDLNRDLNDWRNVLRKAGDPRPITVSEQFFESLLATARAGLTAVDTLRHIGAAGAICPTHGEAVLVTHISDSQPCSDYLLGSRPAPDSPSVRPTRTEEEARRLLAEVNADNAEFLAGTTQAGTSQGASAGEPRSDSADAVAVTRKDWRYAYLCASENTRDAAYELSGSLGSAMARVESCLDTLGSRGSAGAWLENLSLLAVRHLLAELRATARPQVVQSPPSVEGVPTREEIVERVMDLGWATTAFHQAAKGSVAEKKADDNCDNIIADIGRMVDALYASLAAAREDTERLDWLLLHLWNGCIEVEVTRGVETTLLFDDEERDGWRGVIDNARRPTSDQPHSSEATK